VGCSAIASIVGTSYVLVVTEPSTAALSDLERVRGLVEHFRIRAGVVINKYTLNPEMAEKISDYSRAAGLDFLGQIPFDRGIIEMLIQRRSVIEGVNSDTTQVIRNIWGKTLSILHN